MVDHHDPAPAPAADIDIGISQEAAQHENLITHQTQWNVVGARD